MIKQVQIKKWGFCHEFSLRFRFINTFLQLQIPRINSNIHPKRTTKRALILNLKEQQKKYGKWGVSTCIHANPNPRRTPSSSPTAAEPLPVRRFARMADSREPPPLFNDDDDSRKDDDNDDLFTSAVQVRQEDPFRIPEKR